MTLNTIKNGLMKNSSGICLVAGTVLMLAGTVGACIATAKLPEAKRELEDEIELNERVKACADEATEEEAKAQFTREYKANGKKIFFKKLWVYGKLYAIPVAMETAGVFLNFKSHDIIKGRYLGATAEASALAIGFKKYRDGVVEKYGEDVDKELRFGVHTEEVEETKVNSKGEEKVVKKKIKIINGSEVSEYAKFFDPASREWQEDPEYNMMFLKKAEQTANDMLHARGPKGILFLNEVYDMLDIPRTKAGQVCGWINDPDDESSDTYVDFGIYKKDNIRFVNGYDDVILLDFNCGGNVWEKM